MHQLSYLLTLTVAASVLGLPTGLEIRSSEDGGLWEEERRYRSGGLASDMTIVTHNDLYG